MLATQFQVSVPKTLQMFLRLIFENIKEYIFNGFLVPSGVPGSISDLQSGILCALSSDSGVIQNVFLQWNVFNRCCPIVAERPDTVFSVRSSDATDLSLIFFIRLILRTKL